MSEIKRGTGAQREVQCPFNRLLSMSGMTSVHLSIFRRLGSQEIEQCRLVCSLWNDFISSVVTKDRICLSTLEAQYFVHDWMTRLPVVRELNCEFDLRPNDWHDMRIVRCEGDEVYVYVKLSEKKRLAADFTHHFILEFDSRTGAGRDSFQLRGPVHDLQVIPGYVVVTYMPWVSDVGELIHVIERSTENDTMEAAGQIQLPTNNIVTVKAFDSEVVLVQRSRSENNFLLSETRAPFQEGDLKQLRNIKLGSDEAWTGLCHVGKNDFVVVLTKRYKKLLRVYNYMQDSSGILWENEITSDFGVISLDSAFITETCLPILGEKQNTTILHVFDFENGEEMCQTEFPKLRPLDQTDLENLESALVTTLAISETLVVVSISEKVGDDRVQSLQVHDLLSIKEEAGRKLFRCENGGIITSTQINGERFLLATIIDSESKKTFSNFGQLVIFDLDTDQILRFFEHKNNLGPVLKFSPSQGVVLLNPNSFVFREASGDKNSLQFATYPKRRYLM